MQVHTELTPVQRSNIATEHAFTIKASAKAFAVLTNNLYSNKPLAILRELCCNAYDSHVAAGKRDVPIEVTLPNRMNPQLTIRDHGLGLDHDDMINIYTKFFESTKTGSDDFIGQLGLGSKSPFSMFKTFSVEARKAGIKRVYTAFLNEEGVPSIAKMSEEATDEDNGVVVTMAVRQDDMSNFAIAAQKAFLHFHPKPIVNGKTDYMAEVDTTKLVRGNGWSMRSDAISHPEGPFVVQGCVAYPIQFALIKEHMGDALGSVPLVEANIDYFLPIGSVDIAPSREALSYDKRTIKAILDAMSVAASEVHAEYQKEFDACANAYEAGLLFHTYTKTATWSFRKMFEALQNTKKFTFKGEPVSYYHDVDCANIYDLVVTKYCLNNNSKTLTKVKKEWSHHVHPELMTFKVQLGTADIAVLVDDSDRQKGRLVDILASYLNDQTNTARTAIVISTSKRGVVNNAEVNALVKMLGDVPTKRVSTIPFKKDPRRCTYTTRGKEERLQFIGFQARAGQTYVNRVFSRKTWKPVTVDLSLGGFYMPIQRFTVVYDGQDMDNIDHIVQAAVDTELMTEEDVANTYGFNEKEIKQVANDPNWVNLFDYLKEEYAAARPDLLAIQRYARHQQDESVAALVRSYLYREWNTYGPKLVDGPFKTFVQATKDYRLTRTDEEKTKNSYALVYLIRLCAGGISEYDRACHDAAGQAQVAWSEVLNKYPMLKMAGIHEVNGSNVQDAINYINMIDK